jgi:hypothetical protein
MLRTDFSHHSEWTTEFSVTLMFRACVTLGFSKSVEMDGSFIN